MNIAIIAEMVKKRCKDRNVSIKTTLEESGANRNFIYDVEHGRCPSAEIMLSLAEYLDCSVDYLLGRTDKPEINK